MEKTEGPTKVEPKADYDLYQLISSSDESSTLIAILGHEQTSQLMLMPTHHIFSQGDMMGFRY